MATVIDVNSVRTAENAESHYLPCSIDYDGKAKVAGYFKKTISNDSSNGSLVNSMHP